MVRLWIVDPEIRVRFPYFTPFGGVAQLDIEHFATNEKVAGSSPVTSTILWSIEK
jgi:hypothetical protein